MRPLFLKFAVFVVAHWRTTNLAALHFSLRHAHNVVARRKLAHQHGCVPHH